MASDTVVPKAGRWIPPSAFQWTQVDITGQAFASDLHVWVHRIGQQRRAGH